ncbi:MAG: RT0821/Lpp0805 family surface protein [Bacteroidota bacterium]|jgi:surface antigen
MSIPLLIRSFTAVLLALALAAPLASYADPPSHAPAHGWRKKNDPYYLGYTGKKWDRDYGVVGGRCQFEAVGAVLGGVVGGAVGAQVGSGDARTVAIIVGSAVGAVIGAKIGRALEDADRGCIGHALELAENGRPVTWANPHTGVSYAVTPTRGFKQDGQSCREFTTVATANGRKESTKGRACRDGDGRWQIVS